jgi:hypothetical protein
MPAEVRLMLPIEVASVGGRHYHAALVGLMPPSSSVIAAGERRDTSYYNLVFGDATVKPAQVR